MMKSFFKKLAFVMALAMVVTMAAPAAAKAYAADMKLAYQTGGTVTELNMKAGDTEDLRFLGAPANWKELSKKWSSNNEAVAIVDKNGVVTAIKDGVAVITFALGDGTAASATVNVGEVKPYDVTLGNAENKTMTALELKKDATFDFNFYGVKDWNKNNYTVAWSVSGDAVSVDKNGVVTAVKAGKAVVTAAITNTANGVTHNVKAVEVTVPTEVVLPVFTVKQTAADTVVVTFADAQTYTYEDFTVTEIFDTVSVDAPIKASEFVNGTGTTVTVKLSSSLDDGETYEVAFKGEKQSFIASVGEVTDVEFGYYTKADDCDDVYGAAYVETDDENNTVILTPKFFDANGIDVTSVVNADNFSIEYAPVVESDKYIVGYEEVTFESTGVASIKMTATWFDEEDEECMDEWIGEIVATKRPNLKLSYVNGAVFFENDSKSAAMAWASDAGTYSNDFKHVAWGYAWSSNKGTTAVYLEDEDTPVFVAMVSDNKKPSETKTTLDYTVRGEITYDSSNENVFEIDPSTGEITPKKVGTAAVLVYFTENDSETAVLVGSTKVTVKEPRYPATITISTSQAKIANEGLDTAATIKFTVKDQYGDKFDLANGTGDLTVEANSSTKNSPVLSFYQDGTGVYAIDVDESMFDDMDADTTSDSHSYSVTVDRDENKKIDKSKLTFSVRIYNVSEDMDKMENKEDLRYAVNYEGAWYGNSVDVKVNNNTINFGNPDGKVKAEVKEQNIAVYYVNKNGFRLAKVAGLEELAEGQTEGTKGVVYYTLTSPAIKEKTNPSNNATAAALDNKITWIFNSEDKTALEAGNDPVFSAYATEGTYKATLYTTKSADNKLKKLGDYSISVTNSQPDVIYTGYTWEYATRDNSHYNNFDAIANIVKEMDEQYKSYTVSVADLDAYLADRESNTLDPVVKAIYECLGFEFNPEVDNWAYSNVHKVGTISASWYNGDLSAKLCGYEAKKVSNGKMAIRSVTFEITLPGTDVVVYQTVKVNASISE